MASSLSNKDNLKKSQYRKTPMVADSQRLILFDVDQTLVSLRGGSAKALNSAFEEIHGIPDAFSGMTFAGGLDLPLMKEM